MSSERPSAGEMIGRFLQPSTYEHDPGLRNWRRILDRFGAAINEVPRNHPLLVDLLDHEYAVFNIDAIYLLFLERVGQDIRKCFAALDRYAVTRRPDAQGVPFTAWECTARLNGLYDKLWENMLKRSHSREVHQVYIDVLLLLLGEISLRHRGQDTDLFRSVFCNQWDPNAGHTIVLPALNRIPASSFTPAHITSMQEILRRLWELASGEGSGTPEYMLWDNINRLVRR